MNKTIFFYPRRKDTKWAVAYPEKVRGVYIEQIKLTCSSYTEALRIASALNAEAHQALNNYFEAYERLKALQLIE